MSRKAAIGIDIGTSKCCVGVVLNGKVEIIENERGSRTTPSYVAFTDTERLLGDDAKAQLALNPSNTVYGVKRLMGRTYDDVRGQGDTKYKPYKVSEDNGKPRINVTYKMEERLFSPEQITAMLITKMKRVAESHLKYEVEEAVISVPAYFTSAQRKATMHAGQIAGLNVLGLINETTAAAIAYASNKKDNFKETVMVFDCGGGKLDVSIIRLNAQEINVQKVCTDGRFGGCDIDTYLLEYFISEFHRTHKIDMSGNKKSVERLRTACERIKHTLSLLPNAHTQLDCLYNDIDFNASITRLAFDELCSNFLNGNVFEIISRANIDKINTVVLVGGSSRVPVIQEVLKNCLGVQLLDKSVNMNEAVAYGTAVKAALLSGDNAISEVMLREVSSHQICWASRNRKGMLFDANIIIPAQQENNLKDDSFIKFSLFEQLIYRNLITTNILCEFRLSDILEPSQPHGVMFAIDKDGIFNIDLEIADKIVSCNVAECYSNEIITTMIQEEKHLCIEDYNQLRCVAAMNKLESYCFSEKDAVQNSNDILESEKISFVEKCDEIIMWLDDNPSSTKEEYDGKKRELQYVHPGKTSANSIEDIDDITEDSRKKTIVPIQPSNTDKNVSSSSRNNANQDSTITRSRHRSATHGGQPTSAKGVAIGNGKSLDDEKVDQSAQPSTSHKSNTNMNFSRPDNYDSRKHTEQWHHSRNDEFGMGRHTKQRAKERQNSKKADTSVPAINETLQPKTEGQTKTKAVISSIKSFFGFPKVSKL